MRLLASSVLMYAYPLSEIIPLAHEWGYDGIEVWHFHLLQTGEKAADVARLARQHNMYLSVHALSWDLNYTSRLEKVREASLQALENSIRLTHELGAETVVVHPGRVTIPMEDPEESWPDLIEGTRRLVACAQKEQVKFSIEIMEHIPREFFINPPDAARLVKEINSPALSVTVDSAHVPWDQDLVSYFQAAPCVEHVHISDSTSKKLHLPLGKGERDHTDFLRYISKHFPDMNIVIEGMEFLRNPDLAIHNKKQFDILLTQL
jgi:sugar phosphate isomerase/epimerase